MGMAPQRVEAIGHPVSLGNDPSRGPLHILEAVLVTPLGPMVTLLPPLHHHPLLLDAPLMQNVAIRHTIANVTVMGW